MTYWEHVEGGGEASLVVLWDAGILDPQGCVLYPLQAEQLDHLQGLLKVAINEDHDHLRVDCKEWKINKFAIIIYILFLFLLNYSLMYLSIHSFIYSSIHSFIHSFSSFIYWLHILFIFISLTYTLFNYSYIFRLIYWLHLLFIHLFFQIYLSLLSLFIYLFYYYFFFWGWLDLVFNITWPQNKQLYMYTCTCMLIRVSRHQDILFIISGIPRDPMVGGGGRGL